MTQHYGRIPIDFGGLPRVYCIFSEHKVAYAVSTKMAKRTVTESEFGLVLGIWGPWMKQIELGRLAHKAYLTTWVNFK
jgi:hypothetical protein